MQRPPVAEGAGEARGKLGVAWIEHQHGVGHEGVSLPVQPVELRLVGLRESADEGADAIWICEGEGRMFGEGAHAGERASLRYGGLQREPFVGHQRIAFELAIKGVECRGAFRPVMQRERGERGEPVRHVVGRVELARRKRDRLGGAAGDKKVEAGILERAAAGMRGGGAVWTLDQHRVVGRCQQVGQRHADAGAQGAARREDSVGIDVEAQFAGDVGLGGKRQAKRHEGRFACRIAQDRRHRVVQAKVCGA